LADVQVLEVIPALSLEGTVLDCLLDGDLLVEVFKHGLLLLLLGQDLFDDLLVGLFGAKVGLVELTVQQLLKPLLFSVILDLRGKLLEVLHIVLRSHLGVVSGDNVLLLLTPVKFFSFILAYLLDSIDFLEESVVSSFFDLVGVGDILVPFVLRMIIHLKWPMRPQEAWVEVGLILVRNVLPF